MIVILFIVLLIIILLYIYIQSKNHFIVNVIKGTEVKKGKFKDELQDTTIYLGDSVEQNFITYDTQFKFKISAKENRYEISSGNTIKLVNNIIFLSKQDKTEDGGYNNYFISVKHGIIENIRKIIEYERSTKKATVDNMFEGLTLDTDTDEYDYSIFSYDPVPNSTDLESNYAEYNLFNGINCPQQESSDACFKRDSNFVYEALLSKVGNNSSSIEMQTNSDETNMYWKFFDIERSGNKYIYYGDELILKNLGKTVSYLCLCDTNPIDIENSGTVYNMYCYDDLKDAEKYGKWIIIPKYFRTDYYKNNISKENTNPFRKYTGGLKDRDVTPRTTSSMITSQSSSTITSQLKNIYYDFHDDYDLDKLKSKKIPISVKDEFLIINSLPVNGKYVYLNICTNLENNPWLQLDCYNNKYSKVVGTSPSLNKFGIFNTDKLEMEVFNWSIEPIIYDVNVKDTLFVYGSLDIGPEDNKTTLTSDKLRYIKSMPYYFKNKICLKGTDNTPNCIEKHHIEMLNGSRPINIQSITQSKPFRLYSGIDYSGRELKIGFNYNDANNLPYYGDFNEWLNPGDHGKWKSLKIDGPYNAIIYSKPKFGFGGSGEKNTDNFNLTQDEANAIVAREKTIEEIKDAQYDKAIEEGRMPDFEITNTILEKEKVNPLYFVVSTPGISDVTTLGDDWNDGIRSIKFFIPRKLHYELKCFEKYPFTYQPGTDETSVTEELLTSNLCKNGNTNQQFYFSGVNDSMFEPDSYEDLSENHIHFHRHPYDSEHEGVSLPTE